MRLTVTMEILSQCPDPIGDLPSRLSWYVLYYYGFR